MSTEEIELRKLQSKIAYLNGYLDALAIVSSYSIVGMQYRLFIYNREGGDCNQTIQRNAYDLFGVHPDEWHTELIPVNHWEERIKEEIFANFKRRIPHNPPEIAHEFHYEENDMVQDLFDKIRSAVHYFILCFKEEFDTGKMDVYELKVIHTSHYRIVGIDLVFETSSGQVLVLQLLGND
ncbi:hypothetical protein [Fluviicola sp.]|uniref:hypothetical protein n=1 Tax=Fluviicola sp. TaxID=1917219 RepID=UPI0026357C7D|nr:hypothetical protein [Fluviicola sp.]